LLHGSCKEAQAVIADTRTGAAAGAIAYAAYVVPHCCRYQEVLEKELMCVSLRGSCLTPAFHLRDLQGRGLVSCIDTTAGKLVRLVQRK
jgi:hypothetical protein